MWVTRSMSIYLILTSVVTALSMVVLPSANSRPGRVSKALFNYTHWTVIWIILFVYSIQVSAFSVLFGQFFKRRTKSQIDCDTRFERFFSLFFSITGQTHWFCGMGYHFHWFLSRCISCHSLYLMYLSQHEFDVLSSNCSSVWTQWRYGIIFFISTVNDWSTV